MQPNNELHCRNWGQSQFCTPGMWKKFVNSEPAWKWYISLVILVQINMILRDSDFFQGAMFLWVHLECSCVLFLWTKNKMQHEIFYVFQYPWKLTYFCCYKFVTDPKWWRKEKKIGGGGEKGKDNRNSTRKKDNKREKCRG